MYLVINSNQRWALEVKVTNHFVLELILNIQRLITTK